MSTSTRVTRSKGESDGLTLPMRTRPTRRDTALGRNGGTALSTPGREQQQQMSTQTPHLTQLPEAASAKRTATAPMLPPGPHRPLTPRIPLPASPTNSPSAHSTDSSILLALQKQWEQQEKLDMERNQMEKQKEERKRMKEEREQRKEDRK